MLDKKSRIFLRYMDKQPEKQILLMDSISYPDECGAEDDLFALVRWLKEKGYLEEIKSSNSGALLGVQLSHKGRNRQDFVIQEFLRYVGEKWIDFFALLAAIVALVVSIVALQQ